MAVLASTIIDKAERILHDQSNVRWDATSDHLAALNEGSERIVMIKPDANAVYESVQMVAGVWQVLPAKAIQLLDVTTNMGTDGTTTGAPITLVARQYMDACYPGWLAAKFNNTVAHVIYDVKRAPKRFGIYPKSAGANYIEIGTAKLPDPVAIDANINLADEYASFLLDFILFRAYSHDTDVPASETRAMAHWAAFAESLGLRDTQEHYINAHREKGDK